MKILNWILAALDRWDQRRWRKYLRRNRIRYPHETTYSPRLKLETGKYLDILKGSRGRTF